MIAAVLHHRVLAFAALALVGLLFACSGGDPPEAPTPDSSAVKRPSVILVSIDTLRADKLGAYGYDARPTSPRLDALAAEGVLFEQHVAASPWTTPSHMSLLTSLEPRSHGVTVSFDQVSRDLRAGTSFWGLPAERVTLAETLLEAGYATAAFTAGSTLDPRIGFGQGFDRYTNTMYKLHDGNVEEMTAWVSEQAGSDRPFFLFWHHFEVHAPYLSTAFLREGQEELASAIGELDGVLRTSIPSEEARSDYHRGFAGILEKHGGWNPATTEALYAGGVANSDRWLGVLLDRLDELGIADEVLVVVTSDHGEELGEHDPEAIYDRHGHSLYEELIHVPLVVRLPRRASAGTRVPSVSATVDVMPTILDLVGLPPAAEAQGVSLRERWETGADPGRPAWSEALAWGYEQKSVRSGNDKLVFTMDAEWVTANGRHALPEQPAGVELFDLGGDPRETVNLADADADRTERAAALQRQLREHHARDQGRPVRVQLDAETLEQLRALGYVGD
jgi:arylsulfatase A-like enzyme